LVPVARVGGDGRLHVARALRARADLPERFARWVCGQIEPAPRWRVLIGHADARADGERLQQMLAALLPGSAPQLVEAGAAICVHTGPGALVVSLMPDE
jgi:fatty acid-binding protein DegV